MFLQDPLINAQEEDLEAKPQRAVGNKKSKHQNDFKMLALSLMVDGVFQERKAARASKDAMKQLHSESQRLVRGQ